MKRRRKLNGEKIFSTIITCAIVLTLAVGVISVIKSSQKNGSNPDNIVDLNETKQDNVALKNEPVQDEPTESNKEEETIDLKLRKADETPTTPADNQDIAVASPTGASANYSFGENDTLKWPVNGEVIIKYNMDSTVYFKTLDVYKCNPAIVIASQVGDEVIAAASGVVQGISTSEETGTTVTISMGNDYVATYGQLDNVTLKKGSTVVAGDVIGNVSEPTKYYKEEGPNVYFKLTKAGEVVDPTMYLE